MIRPSQAEADALRDMIPAVCGKRLLKSDQEEVFDGMTRPLLDRLRELDELLDGQQRAIELLTEDTSDHMPTGRTASIMNLGL